MGIVSIKNKKRKKKEEKTKETKKEETKGKKKTSILLIKKLGMVRCATLLNSPKRCLTT